jgi:streptogramin lyase
MVGASGRGRHRALIGRLVGPVAVLVVLPFILLGLLVGSASAAATSVTGNITFYTGNGIDGPTGITVGPDGALWFTNQGNNSIGRITTSGVVTNFVGPGISHPFSITVGPDGALWFTNEGSIGRITTSGVVTNYPVAGEPTDIVAGNDDDLWFTNFIGGTKHGSLGRITTAGVVTLFTGKRISGPIGIVAKPGGSVWFSNLGDHCPSKRCTGEWIDRRSAGGTVTEFSSHLDVNQMTLAPQGNDVWIASGSGISKITPAGKITTYTGAAISDPFGIASGPRGNLWFTNGGNHSIGRITPSGVATSYPNHDIDFPASIVAGPDGAMWFTNLEGNSIGRITTGVTPQINSFSPPSGPVGTAVTIKGQNLESATSVTFDGTSAAIESDGYTTIVATVPSGATTGSIDVTTSAGTAVSAGVFTVG